MGEAILKEEGDYVWVIQMTALYYCERIRDMAKLALFVNFETTEDYDNAVLENRRLSMKNSNAPTPADQLREQVERVLGGLRYIEKWSVQAVVTLVESGHLSKRDGESKLLEDQAIPSIINDHPSGGKKVDGV